MHALVNYACTISILLIMHHLFGIITTWKYTYSHILTLINHSDVNFIWMFWWNGFLVQTKIYTHVFLAQHSKDNQQLDRSKFTG